GGGRAGGGGRRSPPGGGKEPPVLMRITGCQPWRWIAWYSHLAYSPRSLKTITVQPAGTARRNSLSRPSHSPFQACLAVAGRIFQATGTAQPRYRTLMASVVKRCPKVVASSARASCRQGQPSSTQRSSGAKQLRTSKSRRLAPALAAASQYHSRRRRLTVSNFWPSKSASWVATAETEQEGARPMPKLNQARPRSWAADSGGKALVRAASQGYSWGRRDTGDLRDAGPREIRLSIGREPGSPFVFHAQTSNRPQ